MSQYTITLFNKVYAVSPGTFWTVTVVGLVLAFAVVFCAVEGLWSINPLLVLAWVVLGLHVTIGLDNGAEVHYCVISNEFYRSIVNGVFFGAGIATYIFRWFA